MKAAFESDFRIVLADAGLWPQDQARGFALGPGPTQLPVLLHAHPTPSQIRVSQQRLQLGRITARPLPDGLLLKLGRPPHNPFSFGIQRVQVGRGAGRRRHRHRRARRPRWCGPARTAGRTPGQSNDHDKTNQQTEHVTHGTSTSGGENSTNNANHAIAADRPQHPPMTCGQPRSPEPDP